MEGRRRALVVQRTGWGKSAVYFVATALRRAEGAGPTVIVSPLLALMRDQIAAAARAGVRAVTMNSANATEWDQVRQALAAERQQVEHHVRVRGVDPPDGDTPAEVRAKLKLEKRAPVAR